MDDKAAARAAAWTFIGVVLGFKLWTIILILLFWPTGEALLLMLAMNWPFLLGALVLIAGPALVWYRLLRARARRRRLLWEEWHLEDRRPSARLRWPR